MKTSLNVLGCVIVLIAAAWLGKVGGLFNPTAIHPDKGTQGGYTALPATAAPAVATPTPRAKAAFAQLVSESKRRAITKYPDLAVANTEINSRFVFRYNWMSKESNARLQEANWPETLADDCAAAAKVTAKSTGKGSMTPRKKLVADAGR